jgi:hypothetical protein
MAEESLSEFVGVVRQSVGEYFYRKASLRGELLHLWLRCSGPSPVLSVVRQSKGQLGECSFHEVELTLSNVIKHVRAALLAVGRVGVHSMHVPILRNERLL